MRLGWPEKFIAIIVAPWCVAYHLPNPFSPDEVCRPARGRLVSAPSAASRAASSMAHLVCSWLESPGLPIFGVIQPQCKSAPLFGELQPDAGCPAPAVVEVGHVPLLDLGHRLVQW